MRLVRQRPVTHSVYGQHGAGQNGEVYGHFRPKTLRTQDISGYQFTLGAPP